MVTKRFVYKGDEDMKNQTKGAVVEKKKVIAITALLITAILIAVLGVVFSIYSFMYEVYIPVLKSQMHGAIFGVVILFLGIRYFMAVQKLKAEVYKETSVFSWNNFKKEKSR